MKKLFVIPALVLLLISNLFSQTNPSRSSEKALILKWAPASLEAGKITIGTEYNFNPKSSFDFVIGIPSATKKKIRYDDKQSEIESKAFSILIGYRHYFGRRSARGFYIEPYAKYLHHQASGLLEGDLSDKITLMDTRTSYEGIGVGAQLGVQFLVFKRLNFDLYFLGLEANSGKFNSRSTDVANNLPWTLIQSIEAKQEFENAINDIPFLKDKMAIEVEQSKKTVSTEYRGFLPGIRIGASIGFRF